MLGEVAHCLYGNNTPMYTKESPSIKEKSTVDQPSYNQGNEAQKSTLRNTSHLAAK